MLAMDALEGIISHLRLNDICGNTNPQPLTAIATGDMRPVNYWPKIGHEQHSLPIIVRRTLSILTEISGRLCQLLTKRLPIIADRDTSVQEDAATGIPLIETSYQNNKLVIGLYGKEGYASQHGVWVNFFGQMIPVDQYSHFQAYLEVRQGRPVNPMSPSRRGVIKDEALNKLCDFIRDSLSEYFSRTHVEDLDPLALVQFYHDYPAQASKLPFCAC
jgi:hypothetical protein